MISQNISAWKPKQKGMDAVVFVYIYICVQKVGIDKQRETIIIIKIIKKNDFLGRKGAYKRRFNFCFWHIVISKPCNRLYYRLHELIHVCICQISKSSLHTRRTCYTPVACLRGASYSRGCVRWMLLSISWVIRLLILSNYLQTNIVRIRIHLRLKRYSAYRRFDSNEW